MAMFSNFNYLDTKSYTLYLSSADKISGTNNNATFDINYSSFLPNDYTQYKVAYSFLSTGGYYFDVAGASPGNYNNCRIVADFNTQSLSYDSGRKAQSITLGFAQRDIQIAGSSSNSFSAFFYQYPGKTINTPNQSLLNIKIYNPGPQVGIVNQLLVNTTSAGITLSDMTSWNMIMEFVPIPLSHVDVTSARQSTRHNN